MPPRVPKTRRYHWYTVLLFIIGTLFPPLAVAARFGVGKDFWLNLLLTIAGYIPGHVHNFYIQNVRNNKTYQRTPKWALRYGLVDSSTIRRHEQRSQWAGKYNDRNPNTGYDQQPLEDGQVGPSQTPIRPSDDNDNSLRNRDGLWRPDDESYYSAEREGSLQTTVSGGRWRYPANFNDSVSGDASSRKKKKKDRWARTEDAYSASGQKKRKKKSKKRLTPGDAVDVNSTYSYRSGSTAEPELPEEATGRVYGGGKNGSSEVGQGNGRATVSRADEFRHEF